MLLGRDRLVVDQGLRPAFVALRAARQSEQLGAERLYLVLRDVGESRRRAARPGHPQAQLGDLEHPGQPRPDDVDRLNLRERKPERPAP